MHPKYYFGGHFDFDYNKYKSLKTTNKFRKSKSFSFYSNARTCLKNILLTISKGKGKILIPDYLCGDGTIDPIEKANWQYDTYKIEKNYKVNYSQFRSLINKELKAILVINYFGIYDNLSLISYLKLKNPKINIIYDAVQNPWFFLDINNNKFNCNLFKDIDYAFTSLNKSLPVPDGAIIYSKNKKILNPKKTLKSYSENWIKNANKKFDFLNTTQKSMKESIYLNNFVKLEKQYNNTYDHDISNFTIKILNRINLKSIALKRKSNFAFINSLIKNKLNKKIKTVPMFYPFVCEKKVNYLRSELAKRKIFLPVHWPIDRRIKKLCTEQSLFLYNNQISLIVDHRMDKIKIIQMLKIINKILRSKQFNIKL